MGGGVRRESGAETATASFGCCGPLEQRLEHRVLGAPLVVAERELAEVPLEPLVGHLPVGAADRRLEVAEEPLDGVRVGGADDVLACGVTDSTVGGEVPAEVVVGRPLV